METYFFVKSDYKLQKIIINDIIYIESLGDYVRFFMEDKKIVSLATLTNLMNILPNDKFVQIHRSYIINFDKINFVQNDVVSIGNYQLSISKSRKKELMDLIYLKMI
ncbi:MAG: LytTR family DNA-binding domain-containing protein [Flavobacteriaceae bacterium]|nr:LytTR family DNA-binding domain-containing protein [Flavobacteriaceae bacterium]